ncbi:MAG: hypothetical protein JSS94_05805 [Bacteroidetes bacterium]|nr:hypothetical protein [Bacteroidota bacterium]
MKNLAFLFLIFISIKNYSQGNLYIYNYSDYDYHGLLATQEPSGSNCYPNSISNNSGNLVVESNSTKYFSSFSSTDSDINSWFVSPNAGAPFQIYSSVDPILNTVYGNPTVNQWSYTRFTMYQAGTNIQISGAGGAIGSGLNLCGVQTSYHDDGIIRANWFFVSGSIGNNHYIIIENS